MALSAWLVSFFVYPSLLHSSFLHYTLCNQCIPHSCSSFLPLHSLQPVHPSLLHSSFLPLHSLQSVHPSLPALQLPSITVSATSASLTPCTQASFHYYFCNQCIPHSLHSSFLPLLSLQPVDPSLPALQLPSITVSATSASPTPCTPAFFHYYFCNQCIPHSLHSSCRPLLSLQPVDPSLPALQLPSITVSATSASLTPCTPAFFHTVSATSASLTPCTPAFFHYCLCNLCILHSLHSSCRPLLSLQPVHPSLPALQLPSITVSATRCIPHSLHSCCCPLHSLQPVHPSLPALQLPSITVSATSASLTPCTPAAVHYTLCNQCIPHSLHSSCRPLLSLGQCVLNPKQSSFLPLLSLPPTTLCFSISPTCILGSLPFQCC